MAGARDGQLRIRRGGDSPPWALQMFDDDVGLWLTLCQADEEQEMIRAGIPILRGPYVISYTDILHDGDVKTLWTPAVGDVLLRLFPDALTVTQWTQGQVVIGQNYDPDTGAGQIALGSAGLIGMNGGGSDLSLSGGAESNAANSAGVQVTSGAVVFQTADPVEAIFGNAAPGDPTAGHVELYALVARAVAP